MLWLLVAAGVSGLGLTQQKQVSCAKRDALVAKICSAPAATAKKPKPAKRALGNWLKASALAAAMIATSARAENELQALGDKGFDASLINGGCMTSSCKLATTGCLESSDCRKGMTCTAKCLGDNACITGCFAKYGNAAMNELLECSVERHGCIKIAILPGGADAAADAPAPPVPLPAFDPARLEGTWYKVLGWNSRYDCFDCQKNSFQKHGDKAFDVDVEFSMPRPPRTLFDSRPANYPLHLTENLVFDDTRPHQRRHASTVGHMFGLTFWENWSVLGQNPPNEPDWTFVYYTGKTTQNTYEGAFVYARQPQLPPAARDSVFALARKAGLDPTTFCAVRNDCETCDKAGDPVVAPPVQRGLFVGAATAAEGPLDDEPKVRQSRWYEDILVDIADYLEDPRATAKWLFAQQNKVSLD